MKKISILALITISLLSSCEKNEKNENKGGDFKGTEVAVHHGKAWSIVSVNKDGNPTDLTITLDDAALNSVPVGHVEHGSHTHENSVIVPLHDQVKDLTPFKFIGLDYNPSGHEPTPIYGSAHFDFHYYMTTNEERLAIPPYQVDSSKFLIYPAQGYMPANYIPTAGGVPQMGTHWIDLTSPELAGQPFTETFIYGSYNGKVTFYEPMMTLTFLKNTQEYSRQIPQPAKVKVSGHYPTKLKVRKRNGTTEISLTSFVYRQAQ